MTSLISLLNSIGTAILKAWEFVISIFKDFMQFLELLTKMPGVLVKIFSWIPGEIWISLSMIFGIVIFYKILGREG